MSVTTNFSHLFARHQHLISKRSLLTSPAHQIASHLRRLYLSCSSWTHFERKPSISTIRRCLTREISNFPDQRSQMQTNRTTEIMALKSHRELVKTVYEDYHIVKSAEDKRMYRFVQLNNEMLVLLVSDPETDKSSAAMDVNVGFMSDPRKLPGLAHFCEHMLFLGTEKYPEENEYSKFLSENGGSSNAYTSAEHTNFYFDLNPDGLEKALDMFAQFFLSPLFTPGSTEREVNAVNSENDKNLQNDMWRLEQLDRSTTDPTHDYSKFGTGNKKTLLTEPIENGIDTREELLKFHDKFYSSNIMSLVILGKESLDTLCDFALPLFSTVTNKSLEVPSWKQHPFTGHMGILARVVPVKDVRNLNLSWSIPDLDPHYSSHPGHYMSHLIGHEGPGSILSELKNRGWSNSLVSGQKAGAKGFMMFSVTVDLTEEGLEHTDDIITLVFQYINMLKQDGPQEWIFSECQKLNAMAFRFKDKEQPRNFTSGSARELMKYPMPEVLSGPYILHEYRPDIITQVMDCLLPSQVRIAIISKTFEGLTNLTEKWYKTDYSIEKISPEIIKNWEDCGCHDNLKLPPQNEFIANNFDLLPREVENSLPEVIKQSKMWRLWYKQDTKYLLPKACMTFEFRMPLAYQDPLQTNNCYLFVELFKDSLNEYTYAAEIANLRYSLDSTVYGMKLTVKGYNDKQHVLIHKVIEKLATFEIDEKRFNILAELYTRGLRNFEMEQPTQHVVYYTSLLITELAWTKQELLDAMDVMRMMRLYNLRYRKYQKESGDVTLEGIKLFGKQILSRMFIEGLIHGNVAKQSALEVADDMETMLKKECCTKPIALSQHKRLREIQMPDGCCFQYKNTNGIHKSSCLELYYQSGMQYTASNALLELFCQIINEPCFNILRTQEQLGYIVFSGIRRSSGVQGLRVIVQSDKHPDYVETRIEFFLLKMRTLIREMTQEDFTKHVNALATQKLEKPKKMSGQHAQYWGEISCQQFNFDRDNIEVEYLKTLHKADMLQFYDDVISYEAPKRHKLSVHVISTATPESDLAVDIDTTDGHYAVLNRKQKVEIIADEVEFKRDLPLFPLPKPYIDVNQAKSKL